MTALPPVAVLTFLRAIVHAETGGTAHEGGFLGNQGTIHIIARARGLELRVVPVQDLEAFPAQIFECDPFFHEFRLRKAVVLDQIFQGCS